MSLWIKDPLAIFAEGAERGLLVAGGRIVELVGRGAEPSHAVSATFEAGRHVVLPGLINSHHHFYQTLTRACPAAIDKEFFAWLKALYPIWAGLEPDGFALAVRVALAELMLSGCTTASDHHYVFPARLREAIDIEVAEAVDLGIRVHLTRGSMSLSEDDGGLPLRSVVQADEEILADSQRLVERHHDPADGAMVRIALAPCSPFSVTTRLMAETAALAERLDVRLHTHLAETADENSYCEATFGCRPLDYLDQVGWLTDRTWLAHGIHFTEAEVARLGRAGTGVAHCPSSNHLLASGHCRVRELEAAGAPVGLAVDGAASQDCSNLMQEVRQAFLLQRLHYGAPVDSKVEMTGLCSTSIDRFCCWPCGQAVGSVASWRFAQAGLARVEACHAACLLVSDRCLLSGL